MECWNCTDDGEYPLEVCGHAFWSCYACLPAAVAQGTRMRAAARRRFAGAPERRKPVHGTRSGYVAESRIGVAHCAACRKANAAYMKAWRVDA